MRNSLRGLFRSSTQLPFETRSGPKPYGDGSGFPDLAAVTDLDNLPADYVPKSGQTCSKCSWIFAQSKIFNIRDYRGGTCSIERQSHHEDKLALIKAARLGCHVCTLLARQCSPLPDGPLTIRISYVRGKYYFGIEKSVDAPQHFSLYVTCYINDNPWATNEFMPYRSASVATVSTKSTATMKVARGWLASCKREHGVCSARGMFSALKPKRLLRVAGTHDMASICLVDSSDEDPDLEYLTLSHCWGGGSHLQLTKDNHALFRTSIAVGTLPKTFKDAVDITVRLGFKYLWIDALCIVQDDVEDWEAEAPRMGAIYGNSSCTIAALTSVNSSEGCYAWRWPLDNAPCVIKPWYGSTITLRLWTDEDGEAEGYNSELRRHQGILQTRGWVFQERALSARILYFSSHGIGWECCRTSLSEFEGNTSGTARNDQKHALASMLRSNYGPNWHHIWWELIETYTTRNLTKKSDRWPAISGIANVLQGFTKSPILLGMWQTIIRRELLWKVSGELDERRMPSLYPTWSWLSVDRAVSDFGLEYDLEHAQYFMEVLLLPQDLGIRTIEASAMTKNESYLRLKAPMVRCKIIQPRGKRMTKPTLAFYQKGKDKALEELFERSSWFCDSEDVSTYGDVWFLCVMSGVFSLYGLLVRPDAEHVSRWTRVGVSKCGFAADSKEAWRRSSFIRQRSTIDLY